MLRFIPLPLILILAACMSKASAAVIHTRISVKQTEDGMIPFDQVRVGGWTQAAWAGAHNRYEFDVDGNGTVDFGLYTTIERTDTGTPYGVYAAGYGTFQILGCPYPPPLMDPDALGTGLAAGFIIGADAPSLFHPGIGMQWGGTDFLTGRFNLLSSPVNVGPEMTGQAGTFLTESGGELSRYLAFRILKEDGWHYGWLEAGGSSFGLSIYGIAWETEAGKTIIAGMVPEPSGAVLSLCGIPWFLKRRRPAASSCK